MIKKNGTSFEIDKGVPHPSGGRGFRKRKYPFLDMNKGESFAIPPDVDHNTVRAAASYWGIRHPGTKFSICKTDEGYRCWRIE